MENIPEKDACRAKHLKIREKYSRFPILDLKTF